MKPTVQHRLAAACVLAAAFAIGSPALAAGQAADHAVFRDPLDVPAAPSRIADKATLVGAVRTPGGRLVAVGRRGIIVTSDDGVAWKQARVPVSTDLVAVRFPSALHGWAVGHGGVVLHSADGGLSWQKQLDGRRLPAMLIAHFKPLAEAGDEAAKTLLADAERYAEDGPGRPLLDLWFDDEQHGTVVGAYNLALRTEDGGQTWRALGEQIANPQGLHLYGITTVHGSSWIAGEQGLLLKGDAASGRYTKVDTPYPGTFFGLAGSANGLLLFGLRGHALRSSDGGASWTPLDTATQSSLSSGAVLDDGRLVLVGLSGEALLGSGSGDGSNASFTPLRLERPMPWYHVSSAGPGRLLLVGAAGVRVVPLPPAAATSPGTSPLSPR